VFSFWMLLLLSYLVFSTVTEICPGMVLLFFHTSLFISFYNSNCLYFRTFIMIPQVPKALIFVNPFSAVLHIE
jgi:hypothetical protein